MDPKALWEECQRRLRAGGLDARAHTTWIRPLQCEKAGAGLCLLAHNAYILEHVKTHYLAKVQQAIFEICGEPLEVTLAVQVAIAEAPTPQRSQASASPVAHVSHLNPTYTFGNFVRGRSNEIAVAAAVQASQNAGSPQHNPLVIYGDVGLGKTHIMHAIGHEILSRNPGAQVLYVHAERFVSDMVKALQHNAMDDFKHKYRTPAALLIDDIQFFARKERSQEELFHTFNAMLQGEQQMIMTSDRYPKELEGMEERLRSRFSWGLAVSIDPPELETRVAILMSKAEQSGVLLPQEVAFFIAKLINANVRELEGALKRVIANAHFTGRPVTLDFARDALRDLLEMQARYITLDNIQRAVAKYYKIRVSELLSKKRTRAIARPRQLAMALAKELTQKSLPEIGEAFGGRDHTTVLHACRTIAKLRQQQDELQEDWDNLNRLLASGQ